MSSPDAAISAGTLREREEELRRALIGVMESRSLLLLSALQAADRVTVSLVSQDRHLPSGAFTVTAREPRGSAPRAEISTRDPIGEAVLRALQGEGVARIHRLESSAYETSITLSFAYGAGVRLDDDRDHPYGLPDSVDLFRHLGIPAFEASLREAADVAFKRDDDRWKAEVADLCRRRAAAAHARALVRAYLDAARPAPEPT